MKESWVQRLYYRQNTVPILEQQKAHVLLDNYLSNYYGYVILNSGGNKMGLKIEVKNFVMKDTTATNHINERL